MSDIKNTVLIVDDEPQIRKMLKITLEGMSYKTEECDNGKEGVRLCASVKPDLVLLDLGLPDMDGKEVIEQVREWSQVPIIVLSVRDDDEEIAKALNLGADDYVTKPFNHEVLLARINANLRKAVTKEAGESVLENGKIKMDLVRHEVFLDDEKTSFTPKEYELLRYLMTHRGKMLTHKQILKDVWGPAHGDDMQYLRVYIGQIREKIEKDSSAPDYIVTEPGIGYRMETVKRFESSDNTGEDAA
ncbi:MAG: response regulator transcription factor [Rickettsiales bacterium]|nr:response regulator transcription factor [Rickettsiales bacterium]